MRTLRTDLTLAIAAVAALLVTFGLSQGCRPERPDATNGGTAEAGATGDQGDGTPPDVPDEPLQDVRKQLQREGYAVVTVDPTVFWSWLDGKLAAGQDVELGLAELGRANASLKVAVLIADTPATPWGGLQAMRDRMERLGVEYHFVFGGYPGLVPAVAAGPNGAPVPPDSPPGRVPGGAPHGDGAGH